MPCSIAEGSLGHSVEKNITTTVNLLEVDLPAECQKVSVNKSPRVRGSVLRNPDYTWNGRNPCSTNLVPRVFKLLVRLTKKPEDSGYEIDVPLTTNSEIQYLESGIDGEESRIQDCVAFPYMGEINIELILFCKLEQELTGLPAYLPHR